MIRTFAAAIVLTASLSTTAHASPNVRGAIHAATSQAIAAQGNRALNLIKQEALRVLAPVMPELKKEDAMLASVSEQPAAE